jgi:uncharacterized membrane protein YraQ (UPF0718 family)
MLWVMFALAGVAALAAQQKGLALDGVRETGRLLAQVGPVLIPAFLLAGMVSVLVSTEMLSHWLGAGSGPRGLLIGTIAGALTPGGPFLAFPLLAVLLEGGASLGAVVAYLSSWSLLGVHRMLAFEIPIFGLRFVLVRVAASLIIPPLIGWTAEQIWTHLLGRS